MTQDLWEEAISDSMEQADTYDTWLTISEDKRKKVAERLSRWAESFAENDSYAAVYASKDHTTREEMRTKILIDQLKKDAEDWKQAFIKNVASRRGWDKNLIAVSKDGEAYLRTT